jgi:hypothetical protein
MGTLIERVRQVARGSSPAAVPSVTAVPRVARGTMSTPTTSSASSRAEERVREFQRELARSLAAGRWARAGSTERSRR